MSHHAHALTDTAICSIAKTKVYTVKDLGAWQHNPFPPEYTGWHQCQCSITVPALSLRSARSAVAGLVGLSM